MVVKGTKCMEKLGPVRSVTAGRGLARLGRGEPGRRAACSLRARHLVDLSFPVCEVGLIIPFLQNREAQTGKPVKDKEPGPSRGAAPCTPFLPHRTRRRHTLTSEKEGRPGWGKSQFREFPWVLGQS